MGDKTFPREILYTPDRKSVSDQRTDTNKGQLSEPGVLVELGVLVRGCLQVQKWLKRQ